MAPPSRGLVREWHDEEGWGVIDSADTPGGCWAHFVNVMVNGHKTFRVGQDVEFTFEPADQDGYVFRAPAVWPAGQEPVDDAIQVKASIVSSRLLITFDNPNPPDEYELS